jgi:hypothetical protein
MGYALAVIGIVILLIFLFSLLRHAGGSVDGSTMGGKPREKEQFDEPQEEFVNDNSIPSRNKSGPKS